MSFTKEYVNKLKGDYNLTQSQINDFASLLKEHPAKSTEDML
jgi:hypothetical protein